MKRSISTGRASPRARPDGLAVRVRARRRPARRRAGADLLNGRRVRQGGRHRFVLLPRAVSRLGGQQQVIVIAMPAHAVIGLAVRRQLVRRGVRCAHINVVEFAGATL